MGLWTVHDVLWLAETNWKNQNLRLLFIEQYMNSNRSTQKAQKRVKKKKRRENADVETQTPYPNALLIAKIWNLKDWNDKIEI